MAILEPQRLAERQNTGKQGTPVVVRGQQLEASSVEIYKRLPIRGAS